MAPILQSRYFPQSKFLKISDAVKFWTVLFSDTFFAQNYNRPEFVITNAPCKVWISVKVSGVVGIPVSRAKARLELTSFCYKPFFGVFQWKCKIERKIDSRKMSDGRVTPDEKLH